MENSIQLNGNQIMTCLVYPCSTHRDQSQRWPKYISKNNSWKKIVGYFDEIYKYIFKDLFRTQERNGFPSKKKDILQGTSHSLYVAFC